MVPTTAIAGARERATAATFPVQRLESELDGCETERAQEASAIIPPAILLEDVPLSAPGAETVRRGRCGVESVLTGRDDRLVVVVGPCTIHCVEAAREYAALLHRAAETHADTLLVVMRVYFEKPRAAPPAWKGLINDPALDGSFRINKGLRMARELLCHIVNLGLPVGCELLDPITPQYISNALSWGAVGPATSESQIHRELASGCSMPIGFKNGTDGNLQIAVDAVHAAQAPHVYPGVTKQGMAAILKTRGNPNCHVILRGATSGPNYSAAHVKDSRETLEKAKLRSKVMIDVSHGNSQKKHENQPVVLGDICQQIAGGCSTVFGVMIESNLNAGNQGLKPGVTKVEGLKYGVSVTDACVDWATTLTMLDGLAAAVQKRREVNRRRV
eukprot:TRINITY_DN2053_c0_g5_i2.p1 TRINITY_DN2053_c0_g5~~TRINITY_DN2053_c0_g5_i2.p1  ORF type:complete len:389 (+),score=132.67 TRINITY_DN2053_c0_g5_i2:137-1303(+)